MRIAIFCGSSLGTDPRYEAAARNVGDMLARAGHGVVYGGGKVGLMGVTADAALAAGGEVIGVIPRHLQRRELAHNGLTRLYVVDSMHARKAQMAALSDAFVALPGGAGTLEEIFEVWTWAQLGLHRKPCAFLNVEGYYDHIGAFVEHATSEHFLRREHRDMLLIDSDMQRLLSAFATYHAPPAKWHDRTDANTPRETLAWVCVERRRLSCIRSSGGEAFILPGCTQRHEEGDWASLSRAVRDQLGVDLVEETAVRALTVENAGTNDTMNCYFAAHAGHLAPTGIVAEMAWLSMADVARCDPATAQAMHWLHTRGLID